MKIDAIAFDLDGTLVDSAPDITHALNSALGEVAIQGFELEAVRAWVGDGPDALILRALGARGVAAPGAELRRHLRSGFDRATLAAPFSRGHVYEGIAPLLSSLAQHLPLVCITNKPTALARAVLAAAQLLPHLCDVLGGDAPEHRKPSPWMLQTAAARRGVPTARMLMVGDGITDIEAAQAAGCPMALVAWGYGHGTQSAGDQVWRVSTPQHLQAALKTIDKGDFYVDRRTIDPHPVPHRGTPAAP